MAGSLPVRVTDRERTVVDMLDRPDLSGGIAEVTEMLARSWREIDASVLTDYVERFGSGTVPKRLGYLAELLALEAPAELVSRWHELSGAGVTLLERGGPATGRIVTHWGLPINAGFEEVAL